MSVFSLEWLICGMECTVGARWIVKLPSMPKLYLGPGLSQRVHRALRQRLERLMANAAAPAETAFQKQRFLFLRIRRSQHRLELLIWNQRKEKSRALTIQMKATNHRQTRKTRKTRRKERLEEMMIDRDLQG